MKQLDREDWAWLRSLCGELEDASNQSRGGLVFFERERLDNITAGLRAVVGDREKPAVDETPKATKPKETAKK